MNNNLIKTKSANEVDSLALFYWLT